MVPLPTGRRPLEASRIERDAGSASSVGGHEILPIGGHENSGAPPTIDATARETETI